MEPAPVAHYPTLKQLRYFVALAEHKHFGRAAAQCFVSQSAFSVAIQELESLLRANLVDRTNRRVTITAVGQEVAVLARLCLRDLAALVEVAHGRSRALEGPLHLGVIPTIAPFLLPRMLPALRKSYPNLKLFLHEDVTDQLHRQLTEGTLDAETGFVLRESRSLHASIACSRRQCPSRSSSTLPAFSRLKR